MVFAGVYQSYLSIGVSIMVPDSLLFILLSIERVLEIHIEVKQSYIESCQFFDSFYA